MQISNSYINSLTVSQVAHKSVDARRFARLFRVLGNDELLRRAVTVAIDEDVDLSCSGEVRLRETFRSFHMSHYFRSLEWLLRFLAHDAI